MPHSQPSHPNLTIAPPTGSGGSGGSGNGTASGVFQTEVLSRLDHMQTMAVETKKDVEALVKNDARQDKELADHRARRTWGNFAKACMIVAGSGIGSGLSAYVEARKSPRPEYPAHEARPAASAPVQRDH